ncbi:MAG: MopE-related protein [Myxococcota bacterium]
MSRQSNLLGLRLLTTAGLLALGAVGLLQSEVAHAQSGTEVLYFTGNGAMSWGYSDTSQVEAGMTAAGATGFSKTSTWPTSLSSYRIVFIISGTTAPSTAQATALGTFQANGGRVVIVSDGSSTGFNPAGNAWAAAANTAMRFASTNIGGGCSSSSGADLNTADAVLGGVTTVGWGYASSVTGGTWLVKSGSPIAARDTNVVLIGDGNMMAAGSCGTSGTTANTALFKNFWSMSCTSQTWYLDADSDSYGGSSTVSACAAPTGYVSATGDCDDSEATVYPGATEVVGDEVDQSCDGSETCFADLDDDGWRTADTVISADTDCADSTEAKVGDPTLDCQDDEPSVNPGEVEVAYDGIDQDCSGDDLCDVDLDGFNAGFGACVGTDCDDANVEVHPLADEVWYDGIDQDCDGWSDYDADYDGFDTSEDNVGDDCDDFDDHVNPDADEIWYDGIDEDCDGASDFDQDFDGHDSDEHGGDDCDDLAPTVYPWADELDDGIDNDCNGLDEAMDGDGDGLTDEEELELGTDPNVDDSDGDGVPDRLELGDDPDDPLDSDGDGIIDALDSDDDDDGIPTIDEAGEDAQAGGDPRDTDGDGTPDYLDLDSDGDGFDDADELDGDADFDGTPDYLDLDSDGDSVLDADELSGDSDGDGSDDRVDADDDGDGWTTVVEASAENVDEDGDGVPNYLDPDSDGDETPDAEEGRGDSDCDGVANVLDAADLDGPCGQVTAPSLESAACAGASTSAVPVGMGGWALGLLALAGLRRRRQV